MRVITPLLASQAKTQVPRQETKVNKAEFNEYNSSFEISAAGGHAAALRMRLILKKILKVEEINKFMVIVLKFVG